VLGGAFYRPERAIQKVDGAGGLAMCIGDAGRGGLGSMLAGFGLGVGALWAGIGEITPVGIVQRAEGKRGGSGRVLPLSLHVSRPGSGQRMLGLDRGGVHEHGYRARANGNSVGHSSLDFPKFCPPGVRHIARKNSNFKFLKSFTLGCQHNKQGFQRYFC
jgi:hypothetical protein